ncbi:hypothetical protein [Paenibacillus sp. Soil787]|uniref:hypothetical protein n=1 Tax=Paenibacillus sp. Soil787 TaxID=1736411 RepID=UPI0007031B3C|nr:hypothetical protein [Paenibacillus sp. Soil787]KRF10754.1 hypothetical protein ASG93_17640 [Paenibacillus sp. Soil787]
MAGCRLARPTKANCTNRYGKRVHLSSFNRFVIEHNKDMGQVWEQDRDRSHKPLHYKPKPFDKPSKFVDFAPPSFD